MSEVRDFSLGSAALVGGITNNLERREAEHPPERQNRDIEKVDGSKATVFNRHTFNPFVRKNVRGMAHTLGIECFPAILARERKGSYHNNAKKHLRSHDPQFANRNKVREADTVHKMVDVVAGMSGKRLRYLDLIVDNGLDSGARA